MKLTYLPPKSGFLGISDNSNPAKDARAVVIPFGFEASVSYGGGTNKGPMAMIKASHQVELFDEELWREPYRKYGVATLKTPPIKKSVAQALTQLEKLVEGVLDAGKFPFVFGGEHSITAGAIRPFARRHKDLTIVHFDAHADLRDGYDGEAFSHAAALRRCLDQKGHQHIKLVSIGIRNISAGEIPFLEKNRKRIEIFWGKDKQDWTIAAMLKAIGKGPIYITFDIDAFDASMIPATGTPEPGGLFWDETMQILRAITRHNKVVGADIVELAPKPNFHACDFMAAKLGYKMLSYVFG